MHPRAKPKIMFIAPSFGFGGIERTFSLIVRGISSVEFDILAVVFYDDMDFADGLPPGVQIINLRKRGRSDNLRLLLQLTRLMRLERPDIVCSFAMFQNYLAVLSRQLSTMPLPVVLTQHSNMTQDLADERFGRLKSRLTRYLYPLAARIICVSEGLKSELTHQYNIRGNLCETIHNPIDLDLVRRSSRQKPPHPWYDDGIPILVSCGRLVPHKNHHLLLRSLARVSESTEVRLLVIGEGELRSELISCARALGIQDRVDFVGFTPNPFAYMARSHGLVVSSICEGFGHVIVEAMACGTPVVSTDCPFGPREIITDGINGLLVPMGDERQLATAIRVVLQDGSLRERLARSGRERAVQFDVGRVVRQYERVFSEVLVESPSK